MKQRGHFVWSCCSALIDDRLKHNQIKRFDYYQCLNAFETYLLRSLPNIKPLCDEQLLQLLKTKLDIRDQFIEPNGRRDFFLAIEKLLSPEERSMMDRFDRGIYEEPSSVVLHRRENERITDEQFRQRFKK